MGRREMSTADHNVMRRVQMEQTLADRADAMRKQNQVMLASVWDNSRQRSDLAATQRHMRKRIDDELVQANKETLLMRRARLKQFLTAEAAGFEAQLGEQGLAFAKLRQ